MEKDLHKRLEEAAELCQQYQEIYGGNFATAYMKGYTNGYNEAIAWAKEWWKSYYKLPDYYYSETRDVQEKMRDDYEFDMEVVADFEADMNKLWEDEK